MNTVTVVTGANGLVGSRMCDALLTKGETVRAVVRRAGSVEERPGLEEWVGDFTDPAFASAVCAGAHAAVTTVHPMGSDYETQRAVGVDGTAGFARAARDAGVEFLVHISTAAVYAREPDTGDVRESSALVPDTAGDYAVTKRDAEAALEAVTGLTRVMVRPPAILGAGDSSTWNSLVPDHMRDEPEARHAVPDRTFAWVHVNDLAAFVADLVSGRIATSDDPELGPVRGSSTAVTVAAPDARAREYYAAVTQALGVDPIWDDQPAWKGRLMADRARAWGWSPAVSFDEAMAELVTSLSGA